MTDWDWRTGEWEYERREMMTTIRVVCPECATIIDLQPEEIVIVDRELYVFHCPTCDEKVAKRADAKILALLLSAGVELYDTPDVDPQDVKDGPPFTPDDSIDLHEALNNDEEVEKWLK